MGYLLLPLTDISYLFKNCIASKDVTFIYPGSKRLNGGPFEEEKPLMTSHGSHDLEDEEVEELGADEEEGEEIGDTREKPEGEMLPSNLSDNIMQDEMDLNGPKDLDINCKSSPMGYVRSIRPVH